MDKAVYKVIIGILIAACLFCLYGWHVSEENRLKLLDDINIKQNAIEELKGDLYELRGY